MVQIDESEFVKLKHSREEPNGNVTKKYWVFGMHCMTSKKIVLKLVRNRKQNTLFPLIKNHIIVNSPIWSDEYSVYKRGSDYPL